MCQSYSVAHRASDESLSLLKRIYLVTLLGNLEFSFIINLGLTRVHRDMHTTGICTVRVRAI